jgi:hypothetical protein
MVVQRQTLQVEPGELPGAEADAAAAGRLERELADPGCELAVGGHHLSDQRLIDWCDGADDAALEAIVDMDRGKFVQRDRAQYVLMHLFTHQIHHRGQAHAMLSGTAIRPPQLDEFVMPSDDRFRGDDLAALGWTEADMFGPRRA